MKLYTYWRSSAAYRLRIALNLKGIAVESVPVHLVRGRDGVPANRLPEYAAVNPQMRVPALDIGGHVLIQTQAILEWLEETQPGLPLLPRDPLTRAQVRAVMNIICCDIHPLNNSSTLAKLRKDHGASDDQVVAWMTHWIAEGLGAVEKIITPGPFALGPKPTLADVVIVPVLYSARRFGAPLGAFPKVLAVDAAMQALDAVAAAAPALQPDAE